MDKQESQGQRVTENIILGADGKYHWYYEYRLMRNPTILLLIWKIFFWIDLGISLMLLIADAAGGRLDMQDFIGISRTFLLMLAIFFGLALLGYVIYAAMNGFKYCVMFEMDDNGVTHTQMPRQFKKAEALSYMALLLAAVSGKPGMAGTAMLPAARRSIVSSWKNVRSVRILRRRGVIKVNERLFKNQVYALRVDFPFVEEFIRNHVPDNCKSNLDTGRYLLRETRRT